MIELDQKENVGMVELRVLTVFEINVMIYNVHSTYC